MVRKFHFQKPMPNVDIYKAKFDPNIFRDFVLIFDSFAIINMFLFDWNMMLHICQMRKDPKFVCISRFDEKRFGICGLIKIIKFSWA